MIALPSEMVLHFSLLWWFPPEVYSALQKENHNLEVIKALNQLKISKPGNLEPKLDKLA